VRRRGDSSIRQRLIEWRIGLSHLVERFDGFMMIVFGEGIAQIVAAVATPAMRYKSGASSAGSCRT